MLSEFTFASVPELAASFEVELKGARIAARAVPWAVSSKIEAAIPEPRPPMKPDPSKGSLAPQVADFEDAGYVAQRAEARRRQTACELAWAISLKTAAGWVAPRPGDDMLVWSQWCAQAADEMMAGLSLPDVRSLIDQIAGHGPMKQVAEAVKN